MDYTAVGQTTHLAARMEQLAAPGSILLAPPTTRLVDGHFRLKALGPASVKGLSETVEVFELVGTAPRQTRLEAAAARGLTRFVGREAEMAILGRALTRARAGAGQLVAVVGAPGAGKSRLVWELAHSRRADEWLSLRGACVTYGGTVPYLPLADLLKELFGIEAGDEPARVRSRVTSQLLALDPTLESALPAVLALLDVPCDDPTWQALDPAQRRDRMADAVGRVLIEQSRERPLLVTIEDLQWIDADSQALLDTLIGRVPGARLLLLLVYRPEYQPSWSGSTPCIEVDVTALSPESAEQLLVDLLGRDASLDPVKRLLISRMEGTPLFLEECVRALVGSNALIGERGAYRVSSAFQEIRVPATVQPILAARIDRLPDPEKELVQAASVIGERVAGAVLQWVAEPRAGTFRSMLTELQTADLLYEAQPPPDPEYAFRHGLTREVAYGSLVAERRRRLHARVMDALEALYAERASEIVERLAHHAVHGEVWDKAVAYLRQAGVKAGARAANQEAVAAFEQALAVLDHLPESRRRLEQHVDLLIDLRVPLLQLGRIEDALARSHEAERLAHQLGDQERLAQVYTYMINYHYLQGEPELAIAYGERCLALGETSNDATLEVLARRYMGHCYHAQEQYRLAEAVLRQNVAALGPASDTEEPASSLSYVASAAWLAFTLAERGELEEAARHADSAKQVTRGSEQHYSRVIARTLAGLVWLRHDEPARALPLLEQSLAECRAKHLAAWQPIPTSLLGLTLVRLDSVADGLELLEEAVVASKALGIRAYLALWTTHLADGLLAAGDLARARSVAEDALDLAIQCKELGHRAWALCVLGEIGARGDPRAAGRRSDFRQALAIAEALGMQPLVARCRLGLTALSRPAPRPDRADAELAVAEDIYGSPTG
jgi:predicted ATPase